MSDHEEYRHRAARVLDGVENGPRHVLTITEPELLALDDPDKPRITPVLSLGPTVADQQRSLATDEAARRLMADGHAEDGTPLGGHDDPADEPTVRTVLRMRRSWLGVLLVDQNTALGRQFVTVYLRADGRAMTEAADRDGVHRFTVMTRGAAIDATIRTLTPFEEASDDDGPGLTYPVASWAEEARDLLAPAKIATVVISRRLGRTSGRRAEDRFTVYNFDDRTELFAVETPERVRIAPVARRTLRERLEEVTRPLEPGASAPDG
ncbi:MAG: hypothetical protein ACRDO7_18480 [Nocardioidaceae bacterium]